MSSLSKDAGASGGSAPGPEDEELDPGTAVGEYIIAALAGRGATADVYDAKNRATGAWVAVKFLKRGRGGDKRKLKRFEAEANAAAKCDHPNVVGVYATGVWNGRHYMVMELVDGVSLEDFLRRRGALHWREAGRVAEQACRGLAAAHAAGVIHRDIKPGNILYSRDGRAKVTDFGLAKDTDPSASALKLTAELRVVGTPAYISPEQARREPLDARTDVYSMGATYYALLVGRGPYQEGDAGAMDVLAAHLAKPPPDPREAKPDIPGVCAGIVLRAMAKKRDDRFQSAEEMADALAAAAKAAEEPALPAGVARPQSGALSAFVEDRPESSRLTARRPVRKKAGKAWLGFAIGAAVVGAAVVMALVLANRRRDPAPKPTDVAKVPEIDPAKTPDPGPDPGPEPGPDDMGAAVKVSDTKRLPEPPPVVPEPPPVISGPSAIAPVALIEPTSAWRFNNGPEFAGAVGSMSPVRSLDGREYFKVTGDFTKGGQYVDIGRTLDPPVDIRELSMWVRTDSPAVTLRLVDSTDQCHQIDLKTTPGPQWQRLSLPLERFARGETIPSVVRYECWGGNKDWKWHGPAKWFVVLMGNRKDGTVQTMQVAEAAIIPRPASDDTPVDIRLDDNWGGKHEWHFVDGKEHPGAKGSLTLTAEGTAPNRSCLRLAGDFHKGGNYVAAARKLDGLELRDLRSIRMRLRLQTAASISVRLDDGTGQVHERQKIAVPADGGWHDIVLTPEMIAGSHHWGGANDGKWHGKPAAFSVLVRPADNKQPVLDISDVRIEALLPPYVPPPIK